MTTPSPGLLLVFEGIDGSGKSTQAHLLYGALRHKGHTAVLSHEPTDGPYGRELRRLAQSGRETLSPQAEYELFVKDRQAHVREMIAPRLAAGEIVVLDRYYFSTMAYQGALGLDPLKIQAENEAFAPRPHRLFLIQTEVALGLDRIRHQRGETPNLFEKEPYLKKVAAIFNTLQGDYIVRLDGSGTTQRIHAAVMAQVAPLLVKMSPR